MISDMLGNISLVFITQYYFAVQKNTRQTMHNLSMKIQNTQELQQMSYYHSSDIEFEDFMNLY